MSIRMALAGHGNWGEKLAVAIAAAQDACLDAVADSDGERLALAANRYPQASMLSNASDIFTLPGLDAVVIATPLASHYSLARAALERGKHVLIEKPLAASEREAIALAELAYKNGLRLVVDHTFVYSGAVRAIHSLQADGYLGKLLYIDSVRINFGLFRPDANVVWDLAAHDFSILDFLLGRRRGEISATAVHVADRLQPCAAHIAARFDDGVHAYIHVSWLAPQKVRRMILCGSNRLLLYDDTDRAKVQVFDKRVRATSDGRPVYTDDGVHTPELVTEEPLRVLIKDFVRSILHGREGPSDAAAGVRVVRLLAAADRSLSCGGRPVRLY